MRKAEIIEKFGEARYAEIIKKRKENYVTKKALTKKKDGLPTECNRHLMVEKREGPLPIVDDDLNYTQTSDAMQRIADSRCWSMKKRLQYGWPWPEQVIVTVDATCYHSSNKTIYTYELVIGHAYTDEQREWFKNKVGEFDLNYD